MPNTRSLTLFMVVFSATVFSCCDTARSTATAPSENQIEVELNSKISSGGRQPTIQDYLRNGSALRDSMDKSAWFYQNEVRQHKETLVQMGAIVGGVGVVTAVVIATSKDDNTKATVGTVGGVVVAACGFIQSLSQSKQEVVNYVNDCNEAITEWDATEKTVAVDEARYQYVVLRKKATRIKSVFPEYAKFNIAAFEF